MPTHAEILIERVDRRLKELGKSRWWLSKEITGGKSHGVITDINRRGFLPSEPRLRLMAEALETTTDYLMGRVETPAQPVSEVSFAELRPEWRDADGARIPLVGTGYCDDLHIETDDGEVEIERVMLDMDHVVRMVERPPPLWNARDAYAIYFQGSSMEPRFYQGEIGIVDPNRPPGPGSFVVVQLTEAGGDDVVTVLVKQLVRQTGAYVELRQFNPELTFRLPRSRVKRLQRIFMPNELLGL